MLQVIQNGAAQASDAKDQLPIWHQVASAEKSELLSSFHTWVQIIHLGFLSPTSETQQEKLDLSHNITILQYRGSGTQTRGIFLY